MPQDIFGSKPKAQTSSPAKKAEKPVEKSQVRDKQAEKPVDLDLKRRIQELEAELKTATATAEQFKANLEAMMNGEQGTSQSLNEDAGKHILSLEQRLFEANQQIEECDGKVKELQEKLAGAYSKAAEAQSRVTDLELAAEDKAAKAQEELAAANDKLAKLEAEATEAIRQNIEACNATCAQANAKVQELEARLAKPGQELADARRHAAEAIIEKDRVETSLQATLTATEERHKQGIAKERDGKHFAIFTAFVLGILLLVVSALMIHSSFRGPSATESITTPARTFLTHKTEAAKTMFMVSLPMSEHNLKLLFGLRDPTCIKGKIDTVLPDVMSIDCHGTEPLHSMGCTSVAECSINFPAAMAAGGSFPATPDNLKALTGQNDPTCYVTNRLSVWGKGKNQLHFECSQYIKDTVRDCWDISACQIEVPKNLDK